MRRFAVGLLLFAFLGQSSGAALAATTSGDGPSPNLWSAVAPVIAAVQDSQLVADLDGNSDTYALSHAPMPRLTRPIPVAAAPAVNVSPKRLAKIYLHAGIRRDLVLPKAPPREHVRDPRAMHRLNTAGARSMVTARSSSQAVSPASARSATAVSRGSVGSSRSVSVSAAATPKAMIGRALLPTPGASAAPLGQATGDTGTGINHYWEYEERAIPGVGKAMVNVGTGNLVVQATDINIPERGLGLVFQRTYNSQSLHDANGDDGSEPAVFGNGWTNTFDAHIVFQASGVISVYDIDGTRCDYTPNAGSWSPCAGEHAQLEPDPNATCAYWWIKKNGTAYYFYSDQLVGCNTPQSNLGRLYEIVGRNSNNNITMTYSWQAGKPKTAQYITGLQVTHSDGQSLTMTFGSVGSGGPTELSTITYPDPSNPSANVTLRYSYDSQGDLQEVDRPGNDSTRSIGNDIPAGDAPETYGVAHPMQFVCGPRATISKWANSGNGKDGSCLNFAYDGNGNLQTWQVNGVLNVTPSDGHSKPLQAGPTDWETWYVANFSYGMSNPACTHESAGATVKCDTDGHSTVWTTNSSFQVTQRNEYTGEVSPTNLVTKQTWDANDNLIATVDAAKNETDYAYDANGNATAVALPPVGDTPAGSGYRATSLYLYDSNNNLRAYCDPGFTHSSLHADWDGIQGHNQPCQATIGSQGSPGATVYQYGTGDQYEPFGRLTDTYTPLGYHYSVSYNTAQGGGGDYGLPTQVQGDAIPQPIDDSRTPVQNFIYDSLGNLISYNKASGESWTLLYDADNRLVASVDPDTHASIACSYLDGTAFYTETPTQHGYDGGGAVSNGTTLCPDQLASNPTIPQYAVLTNDDANGDVVAETHHFMMGPDMPSGYPSPPDSPGVTAKFYDGLDRLVEVEQPQDSHADRYSFPWITRYIYDLNLSGNGPDQISVDTNLTVTAYGNLYETQECLPTSTTVSVQMGNSQVPGPCTFQEVRGNAFDGLDRTTKKFEDAFGTAFQLMNNYDMTPATYGLLDKSTNAGNPIQYTAYTYDNADRVTEKSYDNPSVTPTEDYTYDLDGHVASLTSSLFGAESYDYDADGRLTEKDEPTGGGYADPGVIKYGYYADGKRSSLSLSIAAIPSFNGSNVMQYAYQTDGLIDHERVSAGNGGDYQWTYKPSGRELTQSDPSTGDVINVYPTKGCQNPCQWSTQVTLAKKTYTYDTYGRIATLTFPSPNDEQMAGFTYDAEGETIDDWGSTTGFVYPPAPQYLYSTRGELIWSPQPPPPGSPLYTSWGTPAVTRTTANGAVCNQLYSCTFDTRSSQMLSQNLLSGPGGYSPNYPSYQYDPSGRNGSTSMNCYFGTVEQDHGTLLKSYDAENHVVSASVAIPDNANGGNPAACLVVPNPGTFAWGNSGHPYVVTTPYNTNPPSSYSTSYHWDGSQILYSVTTQSPGPPVVLYVGTIGEVALNPPNNFSHDVFTNDRDYAGQQYQFHNSAVYSQFSPPGTRLELNTTKFGELDIMPPSWGSDTPVQQDNAMSTISSREDGYQMDGVTIQGVRAYDPTSSQWSSPDAFSGDVDDPMSQKPFIWNGNNPLSYGDPTGYVIDANSDKHLVALGDAAAKNSDTFRKTWDAMKASVNVFKIVSDSNLSIGSGLTKPGTGGDYAEFDVSSFGDDDDKTSGLAHEIGGHATDVLANTYSGLMDIPLNGAHADSNSHEQPVAEEARGYLAQYKILTEIYGASKANYLMSDSMPHWAVDESTTWTINAVQSSCAATKGCTPP
jgi:YD repeat-containing protein